MSRWSLILIKPILISWGRGHILFEFQRIKLEKRKKIFPYGTKYDHLLQNGQLQVDTETESLHKSMITEWNFEQRDQK